MSRRIETFVEKKARCRFPLKKPLGTKWPLHLVHLALPNCTQNGVTPISPNTRLQGSKRAMSAWISWVLLVGLGVVLGVFVLNWTKSVTAGQGEDLTDRADYQALCENTGLRLENICQNTQTLNMNVTNNNNLDVQSITARMVDIYGNPQLREANSSIRPSETHEIKIVKQGILQKVELIPGSKSGSKRITCLNKKIAIETIPICQ